MISTIKNIITGTQHYIESMDSIVDLAVLIVSGSICLFFTVVVIGVFIIIVSNIYNTVMWW